MSLAAVAIDTERILLAQERGEFPIRVSIVDESLNVLMDEMIKTMDPIDDFRTEIHGLTPEEVNAKGISFGDARKKVETLIRDKLVVGHDLGRDLLTLLIHDKVPKERIRDTGSAKMFAVKKTLEGGNWCHNKPSLKDMAKEHLNEDIQGGPHNSVEDASASMKIYKKFKGRSDEDWAPV